MKYLAPPDYDAVATYQLTLSRMKSGDLRTRMVAAVGEIAEASRRYVTAAQGGGLGAESDFRLSGVTEDEMASHYEGRFVHQGSAGRPVYDEILLRAQICLLCGHGKVSTLDHYWPKRPHAALAVNPLNLVPCCRDCNHIKHDFQPTCRAEELLHPYFDNLGSDPWLHAEVMDSAGRPVILFSARPPAQWDEEARQRVVHHFRRLRLDELYAIQAATELAAIAHELKYVFDEAGHQGVGAHLQRRADSYRRVGPNSWQTAMHQAMASSQRFCAGWFV